MLPATAIPLSLGVAVGSTFAVVLSSRKWRERLRAAWRSLFPAGEPGFFACDASALEWRRNRSSAEYTCFDMKSLLRDSRSGQSATLVRYPAGQSNPLHQHRTGHGMFVLEGELVTHRGSYGPGHFVWFPAGEPMVHGAGEHDDLVALLIHSGHLGTRYLLPAQPLPQARVAVGGAADVICTAASGD